MITKNKHNKQDQIVEMNMQREAASVEGTTNMWLIQIKC